MNDIFKKIKMKKWTLIAIIIVVFTVNACMHKPDIAPCIAGTGGNLSIVAYASYGNISIPNYYTHLDTAFVKFGTLRSPGTNPVNFDTYYVGDPGEDHIHCYGLKCGDYFIYRTAWDSVANVRRYGGYGINISDIEGGKSIIVAVN
jgi:hypothetical protein